MPRHKYPFLKHVGKTKRETMDLTWIPIRLSNPMRNVTEDIFALIDTGADASVIPAYLATRLQHKLKGKGVNSQFTSGIGGKQVKTYQHTFDIGLISSRYASVVWNTGPILVDYVESLIPPILGVEDFLKHFRVVMDYPKKTIPMQW